jgi:hypothetical protein
MGFLSLHASSCRQFTFQSSGGLYVKRVSCAQVMQFDLYGKLLLTLGDKFKPTEFCKPTQVLNVTSYPLRANLIPSFVTQLRTFCLQAEKRRQNFESKI